MLEMRGIRRIFQISMLRIVMVMAQWHPFFKAILMWFVNVNSTWTTLPGRQRQELKKVSDASTETVRVDLWHSTTLQWTPKDNLLVCVSADNVASKMLPRQTKIMGISKLRVICLKNSEMMTYL